jgi:hypothetical protein
MTREEGHESAIVEIYITRSAVGPVSALVLGAAANAERRQGRPYISRGQPEISSNFIRSVTLQTVTFSVFPSGERLTTFDTGETGMASSVEYIDVVKGVGTTAGYATITFVDGSSFTARIDYHFSIGHKGLVSASIKTEYVKGTGRFEGIKGTEVITGRQISTTNDFAGFFFLEGTATYTLPK